MVKAKSLLIKRVRGIVTFKDMETGKRHYTTANIMIRVANGWLPFTYAGEYIPLGAPKKENNANEKEVI